MGLAELRADAKLERERIAALPMDQFDAKRELTENILPLLEGLAEAIAQDNEARDEVIESLAQDVDDLVDQSGDVLHPETTAKILGMFEAGKLLANELEKAINKFDDVTKKRIRFLIRSYRQGVEVVGSIVQEITMAPDEIEDVAEAQTGTEEEEGEEGDEEEGEEDGEEDADDADDEEDDEEPDDNIAAGGDK